MSAAQLHVMIVHLPVVGTLAAFVLLVAAMIRHDDRLYRLAELFLIACAVFAAVAYYSGPVAYDRLQEELRSQKDLVEQHALIGRIVFVGLIIAGVLAVQSWLQRLQGESVPRWLRWLLLVTVALMVYAGAWTAHLGGLIRHPELRQPVMWFFPELGKEESTTINPGVDPGADGGSDPGIDR